MTEPSTTNRQQPDATTAATSPPAGPFHAPDAPVRATFRCTVEDYAEATVNARQVGWRAAVRPILSAVYLTACWGGLLAIRGTAGEPIELEPPKGRAVAALYYVWLLAPVLVLFPVLYVPAFRFAAAALPAPWDPRSRESWATQKVTPGRALIAVAAMATFPAWLISTGDNWYVRLLALTPVFVLLCLLIMVAALANTRGVRRRWGLQPWLAGETVVEADPLRLVVTEPDARHDHRWASLVGYRETANLLLIYPSPFSHYIIPKSGFAGPADLTRFKALVATHIAAGLFLDPPRAVGFPVAPAPVSPMTPPDAALGGKARNVPDGVVDNPGR